MIPGRLVPGIDAYPELAAQMIDKARRSTNGCARRCDEAKLAEDFRERLKARLERDKWLRKP